MKLSCWLIVAAALVVRPGIAQQQTGAPAGIPVPLPYPATAPAKPQAEQGAYTFRVLVLDGRNGTPVPNAHGRLWYDEPAGPGFRFDTDQHGYASMPSPDGAPVRVLAQIDNYVDCRRPQRGDPPVGYNLQSIAKSGSAVQNTCGLARIRTQPGELVLFVRSPRWYEGLNQGLTN